GMFALECIAQSKFAAIVLELDFVEERLTLDPINRLYLADDGSMGAKAAELAVHRVRTALFMNGILEVWNAETGGTLGRTAPFLPVNMRYDHNASERETKRLTHELLERSANDGGANRVWLCSL
ncbi:MAG: hypothetical protein HY302_06830, partial [Opitutae bacterium]|nr:hypothetical protein [Opitutae bacterium]